MLGIRSKILCILTICILQHEIVQGYILPATSTICSVMVPEYVKGPPQTSDAPYYFLAMCKKDWSRCLVTIRGLNEEIEGFQEVIISGHPTDHKKEPRFLGGFPNKWPGHNFYYRTNYRCSENGIYRTRPFNPISLRAPEEITPIVAAQVTWLRDPGNMEENPVFLRATIIRNETVYWTDVYAFHSVWLNEK